ncbi:MAG: DUF4956 domain-containing protein [Candidatus Eisenbacteria bacterium]|uniref:DUF4956 domain-containing protein n=1 Tax=Eiseniibacteriota bacterium TaxID=2212470 RepID=A0A938BPS1_UNCEI|nr:DUF4956 domain-containing protein [Candidatus Eisenbacteria bacterium]
MLNDMVIQGQRFLLVDILVNMAIAFVLGVAVALVYRRTHRALNYSVSFVGTLVFLPMVTAIVMMVIGNNLARAFGLVGAMSIIRFRTVVKDTRDTVFVFLALAAGMAAGTGYHMIALAGTGFVMFAVLLLYFGNFGSVHTQDLLLRFSIQPDERGAMLHEGVFKQYLKKQSLLNIQTRSEGRLLELSYFVRLRAPDRAREFVRALGSVEGIDGVSLISMDESAEP